MKMSDSPELTRVHAENLIANYLQPESNTQVNISDALRNSIQKGLIKGNEGKEELTSFFKAAQAETLKIMALGAFPRFLMSTAFEDYRNEMKKESVSPIVRRSMVNELDKLLESTSWLKGLLASVENLPICVSLATANKQMSGFPLIYVNTAFETTTGYSRSEIIGQNCRFLQVGKKDGHIAEPESVKRMTESLGGVKPLKVAITNFRKDGTPFRNLLAMKPIFDSDGEYAFVLGIQFDIGHQDASSQKMKIIDDMFRVIPNTVMSSADTSAYKRQ